MSKITLNFGSTVTGHIFSDFTVDFCDRQIDGVAVSTSGMSIVKEHGLGVYTFNNANVTANTVLGMHLTTDTTKSAVGMFAVADDNIAMQSTVAGTLGTDGKALVSANSQDLSATFKVDAKIVEDKNGYSGVLTGSGQLFP